MNEWFEKEILSNDTIDHIRNSLLQDKITQNQLTKVICEILNIARFNHIQPGFTFRWRTWVFCEWPIVHLSFFLLIISYVITMYLSGS